ncbi:MAG TPA: hypothetical protein ENH46_05335, partial [Candidatus Pacearchaeota archaeon]|nr:hypothetical protein [Candidatus Pacearchaeota archaeon]
MKSIFVLCSEGPGLCDDIKELLEGEMEENKNLKIVIKEGREIKGIPKGYDGYHINVNGLSVENVKKLRADNP